MAIDRGQNSMRRLSRLDWDIMGAETQYRLWLAESLRSQYRFARPDSNR
jgi:hypothetical protein